jgi:nitrogen fixation/metabolism regulation signal transduction histidine kinase
MKVYVGRMGQMINAYRTMARKPNKQNYEQMYSEALKHILEEYMARSPRARF